MRLRACPSAALAACLLLAWSQAASAAPSITPIVYADATGPANVDDPSGTIQVVCHVNNPKYDGIGDPTPTGNVYFIGVSRNQINVAQLMPGCFARSS
jgi:hypothetical protein